MAHFHDILLLDFVNGILAMIRLICLCPGNIGYPAISQESMFFTGVIVPALIQDSVRWLNFGFRWNEKRKIGKMVDALW